MDLSHLESFAEALTSKFSLPGAASAEDQLKPVVADLLTSAGSAYGYTVETRTETHLSEYKVRPDIAVYINGLICGYIELKAPGQGADPTKLKGKHNKQQWQKLKSLPNLVYTDGQDWALYRDGERKGGILRLDDDPTTQGKAATSQANADALGGLLRDFLGWMPVVPHKPTPLAEYLAPLTRFLRSEVEAALENPSSAAALLAGEWRRYFFPSADDSQFADAYAQTVTYSLLLARLFGASDLEPAEAAKTLGHSNGVLALALDRLGQPQARDELRVGFELLQRSLRALDPAAFLKATPDMWLYFYEDFLAAYDPKLRKDFGVYYTPREVVELQVRMVSELLETRFGKKQGFADEGVVFLDPAVGTGTYPVAAVKHGLDRVRARYGEGAVPSRASQMARNMHAFELLVGPYAVAHLRLSQALESEGATLNNRLNVYLADALESPNAAPPGGLTLTYKALTDEHEAARQIKNDGEILVCLGNPPYDREQRTESSDRKRKGGWVRHGDQIEGAAKQEKQGDKPIFDDFLEPARKSGRGLNLQVIFNDYVYFWRWALWRLFEQQSFGGIISFITASSYLTGPGFVGMREVMRRMFDELWIIDLGGDNLGARKTPNVFAIQTPVAIGIGVRGKNPSPDTPAKVHYTRIDASTRDAKIDAIGQMEGFASFSWQQCANDWQAPFRARQTSRYFDWPKVTSIFPYHTAGAVFYRSWPIGETESVLRQRWDRLKAASVSERRTLFKESRDRKIDYRTTKTTVPGYDQPSVRDLTAQTAYPVCVRYGFRSLDRQYAFYDFRLGDYLRPSLYTINGDHQIFLVAPDTLVCGEGAAAVVSAHIPDQHYFRGSFGGRDIIPLYRDAVGTEPNVTAGLPDALASHLGTNPSPEDLAAYVYAILGGQSYTKRFWNELEDPGPRIPITKDPDLFAEAVALGRRLIWLHTYAERFQGAGHGDEVPSGDARCIGAIPDDLSCYPESFDYDPDDQQLRVGDGRFAPVTPDVWAFEVSGLKVVQSWLGYRMRKRAGKKSSPLDDIRPKRWSPQMTDELLELLWVVEATLAMEPDLAKVLEKVVAGDCFTTDELPEPKPEERKAPGSSASAGGLFEMMGDEAP